MTTAATAAAVSMTSALVLGSTGAVGSHILATLLDIDNVTSVTTISRRLPTISVAEPSSKLLPRVESDTTQWPAQISGLEPPPAAVFNALGTTRAAAGSLAAQWAIDHDLCIATAKAAKAAGARTYVFVSSGGTRGLLSKHVPYSRMKIGVEDAIAGLGFEQAIVLRPGMIVGQRERPKSVFLETVLGNLHHISWGLQDLIAQDQVVIARAAVAAARLAQEGKAPSRYWVLEQADIVRYGRDEWK